MKSATTKLRATEPVVMNAGLKVSFCTVVFGHVRTVQYQSPCKKLSVALKIDKTERTSSALFPSQHALQLMVHPASHALVIPGLEVRACMLVVSKRGTAKRTEVKHIHQLLKYGQHQD